MLPLRPRLRVNCPTIALDAGRDRHRDALANQLPRHRVAVGIDLDGTVVADDARQLA